MTSAARVLTFLLTLMTVVVCAGCGQEGPAERTGQEVDQAADNVLEAGQQTINKAKGLGQTLEEAAEQTAEREKGATR